MNRKWALGMVMVAVLALVGCNQTVEEQASAGMLAAETTFEKEASKVNKTYGQVELYLPKGFAIEQGIDEANFILTHDEDIYILFVNEHETEDSRLLYEILQEDASKEVIQEKTFETDGVFGFSAIISAAEETSELVVSIGGAKLTTISANKNLDEKLAEMMQIVQSVNIIKSEK